MEDIDDKNRHLSKLDKLPSKAKEGFKDIRK